MQKLAALPAYFQQFRRIAEAGACYELAHPPLARLTFFNWVADVAEVLPAAAQLAREALGVDENGRPQPLSYAEPTAQAAQLLSFWRTKGVELRAWQHRPRNADQGLKLFYDKPTES